MVHPFLSLLKLIHEAHDVESVQAIYNGEAVFGISMFRRTLNLATDWLKLLISPSILNVTIPRVLHHLYLKKQRVIKKTLHFYNFFSLTCRTLSCLVLSHLFALACHFNFSALCAFVILNSFAFNDATVAFNVFIVSSNFAILISCWVFSFAQVSALVCHSNPSLIGWGVFSSLAIG